MKTVLTVAASTAILGLAGCASAPATRQAAESAAKSDSADAVAEYMTRVEQIARRRGVQIIWVNPPRPRPETPDD